VLCRAGGPFRLIAFAQFSAFCLDPVLLRLHPLTSSRVTTFNNFKIISQTAQVALIYKMSPCTPLTRAAIQS
jgi:hypothetical protein